MMAVTHLDKHFMELLAPKQNAADVEADFEKFQARYELFLQRDYVICVTDNPMGNLSYMATEMIDAFALPVKADNLMMHLNTFHRKTAAQYVPGKEQNEQDLDILLQHAAHLGIKYLLVVSGDGSERLPRLKPEDLGYDAAKVQTITSVQLIEYIKKQYPGQFEIGVAFNHYEPLQEELEKLERKLAAGATFLITQPVSLIESPDARIAAANQNLDKMFAFADQAKIQVVLEAWMSQKLAHLMPECIGQDLDFGDFEPFRNLQAIRQAFHERKIYFSMIFGQQLLDKVEDLLHRQ